MSFATATPSDRSRHAQAFGGGYTAEPSEVLLGVETIYRRRFLRMTGAPVLLATVIWLIVSVDQVWLGSVLPKGDIVYAIIGPFLAVFSLLWSVLVWYGNHVRVGKMAISIQDMGLLLGIQTKTVAWDEIKDVALSGGPLFFWKRSIVLTLGEGRRLVINGIPEPECLYRHIRASLSG